MLEALLAEIFETALRGFIEVVCLWISITLKKFLGLRPCSDPMNDCAIGFAILVTSIGLATATYIWLF